MYVLAGAATYDVDAFIILRAPVWSKTNANIGQVRPRLFGRVSGLENIKPSTGEERWDIPLEWLWEKMAEKHLIAKKKPRSEAAGGLINS